MPVAENPENGRKPGHDQPSEPGQDHDEDIVCDLHCPDDVVLKSAHGHTPSLLAVSNPIGIEPQVDRQILNAERIHAVGFDVETGRGTVGDTET